ncbi:chemotaxis protein CheB, partial [Calidithermus terrae]|uniref:chemotaxis protein CheB n=1 Tax=Calidithermus terrae TaxID=1408545 RepID=UPI001C3FA769
MSAMDETAKRDNPDSPPPQDNGFVVVGIGASAGGIDALKKFFAAMPPANGMAFVVVLHLAEGYESHLAEVLQVGTPMPVTQITGTVAIEPEHVYVIPPAKHLAIEDGHIRLEEPEFVRGRRVPIDLFFRSLAEAYGSRAVALVLSGTGTDGTLGIKRVKERNGIVMAQSPEDAEYDGMPRSAIGTGMVDVVLPAAELPEKLLAVVQAAGRLGLAEPRAQPPEAEPPPGASGGTLRDILTLLRVRTGHDFNSYKRPTLLRRVGRRMQVHELDSLGAYLELLRERPEEVQALLRDLLITVTNFFRDKEAFAVLEHEIIPRLFAGKGPADSVRVWSCGCATGEEAYSLAILLSEYAQTLTDAPRLQVFASDINEEAVRAAREGQYDETIAADVPPERLHRFFVKDGGNYRVRKEVRDLVLFAPHNVLRDPPFSRLDLVVCRNLLIYLNRDMQERVLELFHFALRPHGYLFLGSSETAENSSGLFAAVDKKQRVYQCRAVPASLAPPPS